MYAAQYTDSLRAFRPSPGLVDSRASDDAVFDDCPTTDGMLISATGHWIVQKMLSLPGARLPRGPDRESIVHTPVIRRTFTGYGMALQAAVVQRHAGAERPSFPGTSGRSSSNRPRVSQEFYAAAVYRLRRPGVLAYHGMSFNSYNTWLEYRGQFHLEKRHACGRIVKRCSLEQPPVAAPK